MKRGIFIWIMSLLLLDSCTQKQSLPFGDGSIAVALSSDIETDVHTKTDNAGVYDSYNIYLEGIHTGDDPFAMTLVFGDAIWPLALPYGLYKVAAESCTEADAHSSNDGFGCVRFYGMTEGVQVKTLDPTEVSVRCTMANAKISISFAEDLLSEFDDVRVELSLDGRTVTILPEQASIVQTYFNVNPDSGSTITYTLFGTIEGNELEYASSILLRPAKHARLTFKSNHNGVLGPQVSVDKEIGTNEVIGAVDTSSGSEVTGGDIEKPVIYVDYDIADAVEIETVIDVIDKEDMTL